MPQAGSRSTRRVPSCHGAAGEGAKEYPDPLAGNLSVAQLSKRIARTMPEDKPGSLSAAEAEAVAAYIHEAFYSVAARERNRPRASSWPGSPSASTATPSPTWSAASAPRRSGSSERGPQGRILQGPPARRPRRPGARADRPARCTSTSARQAPSRDKIEPHEFSIRWNGSVLAPETGEYEFVVRTEHATRLWVNDLNRPLIDAWVKSGNDTEYRGSIFLLGGRAYPLRLEFSKAKQGVDDSKKNKTKPPPVKASIALVWKLPHRAAEVIPARNLSPARSRSRSSLATPFPPDDRSFGYERGTSVSKAWDQATTDAALEAADYVAGRPQRAGRRPRRRRGPRGRSSATFCRRFAERAFRRPLTDEQKRLFVDRQFEAARTRRRPSSGWCCWSSSRRGSSTASSAADRTRYDVAVAALVRAVGLAARPGAARRRGGGPAGHAASRSSSRPSGCWPTRGRRPSSASSCSTGSRSIRSPTSPRTPNASPASTRPSSPTCGPRSSCSSTTSSGASADFRQLLLADYLYLNGRLAKFYGVDLPADAPFQKVSSTPGERAGVLTHPYLMASFAYTGDQLADPPRRVPGPQRPGPCRCGRRPRRSPRWPPTCTRPDDPRARRACRPSPTAASRATA